MSHWHTLLSTQPAHPYYDSNAWSHLNGYVFLIISGPDACSFLQGQCTNDVQALAIGEFSAGAHCNPKGRMISTFLMARADEDRYLLRVHSSLSKIASDALKKYMVFSKANLTIDTEKTQVFFITGDHAQQQAAEITQQLHSQSLPYLCKTHSSQCIELWLDISNPHLPVDLFDHLEASTTAPAELTLLQQGLYDLRAKDSEAYLPQELNLDYSGAVSFKKGCYTGQEIIARLHYKGTTKKRLALAKIAGEAKSLTGSIHDTHSDKTCGQILKSCEDQHGHTWFIAVVNTESVEQNHAIINDDNDTKIEWITLSYAIP